MTKKEKAIIEIQELMPIYKDNKAQADDYKKISDKYNAQIKALMVDNNISEVVTDNTKVTCIKAQRQEFIEEALIAKLKSLKIKGVIKKKEYVDMDALENAIYNGEVNAAQLASCQSCKEVITLRLTSIKK